MTTNPPPLAIQLACFLDVIGSASFDARAQVRSLAEVTRRWRSDLDVSAVRTRSMKDSKSVECHLPTPHVHLHHRSSTSAPSSISVGAPVSPASLYFRPRTISLAIGKGNDGERG